MEGSGEQNPESFRAATSVAGHVEAEARPPITWIKYVGDIKKPPNCQICVLSPKMPKVLKRCVIVLTIFECSLRMKCLRKVVWSLAGKTDIIGTNYCWERRKLFLWCVGDLFGHTFPEISHGRRWCGWSSDLDPSSTLSCPEPLRPQTSNTGHS